MATSPFALVLAAALAAAVVPPTPAVAAESPIEDALAVVLDPVTWQHVGQLQPGAHVRAYVVADSLGGTQMSACQFGLDIDPRLLVLDKRFHAKVVFANEYPPGDFYLGFGTPLQARERPFVLAQFELMLDPQATSTDDLRIFIRDHQLAGPPRWAWYPDTSVWRDFVDAGEVVLNPTRPGIAEFAAGPRWLVEGRPLLLEWSAYGDVPVELDGEPVASDGARRLSPLATTSYRLVADPAAAAVERTLTVDVVRQPRIVSFAAQPLAASAGDTVTLSWEVRGADTIWLQPQGLPVGPISSVQRVLKGADQFVLVAENEWGQSVQAIEFGFSGLPTIEEFAVLPNQADRNDPVVLSWRVTNAQQITLSPALGSVPAFGRQTVLADTSITYMLQATNATGSVQREVTLEVFPVRVGFFVPSASQVFPGESMWLRYELHNATSAWMDPGAIALDVHASVATVTPTAESTVYTLHASDGVHEVTASALVEWKAPEIASLYLDPSEPLFGEQARIRWDLEGADTARLDPDFGPVSPLGGNRSVVVGYPKTYTLTATNAKGTTTGTLVVRPKRPVISLGLYGPVPAWGAPYQIGATAYYARAVRLEPGPGYIAAPGNSWSHSSWWTADRARTFTLTAMTAVDTVVARLTVVPSSHPQVSFSASPGHIVPGGSSTLTWSAAFGDSVAIQPLGLHSSELSGSVVVSPDQSTVYSLTLFYGPSSTTFPAEVTVLHPTVALEAVPAQPWEREQYTLRVSIAGATGARLDPWPGMLAPENVEFRPSADSTTVWTLRGWAGGDTASTTLTVVPQLHPPVIQRFEAVPAAIAPGDSAVLHWSVAPLDSLVIEPAGVRSQQSMGAVTVRPTATQVYTLRAYRAETTAQAEATVAVSQPAIVFFHAQPPAVEPGGFTVLSWEVAPAGAAVTLGGVGPVAVTGQLPVRLFEPRDFTLHAEYQGSTRDALVHVEVTDPAPDGEQVMLVADPAALTTSVPQVTLYQPFDVYAVVVRPIASITAFGLRVEWPDWLIPSQTQLLHGGMNFATAPDYLVGLNPCAPADSIVVLAHWTVTPVLCPVGCPDQPAVVTPAPTVVTGDFGLQECSTYVVHEFSWVRGITIAAPTAAPPPPGLTAIQLEVTPLDHATQLRWRVEGTAALEEIAAYRSDGDGPFLRRAQLSGSVGEWIDAGLQSDVTYRYRVRVVASGGTLWSDPIEAVPTEHFDTRLLPNVPNPFNPATEIRFEVGAPGRVQLRIVDVAGRNVRQATVEVAHAGPASWAWDGLDDRGAEVGSGVYVVRLQFGALADTRRITVLR